MSRINLNDSSDDEQSSLLRNQIEGLPHPNQQNSLPRRSSGYLNEINKPQRFRDIRICYFGMFISSIVFSMTVSSLWPYLSTMDDKVDTSFLGLVVAALSVGQLIASPLLGYMANKMDNNRIPLILSTILIVVANILYSYVNSINIIFAKKWWLLIARFIMGVGSGNSAVMRSYASAASTLTERTSVMANMSASQGIGFIIGPLFQALFTLITVKVHLESPWFPLNAYTAPGYFAAITATINVLSFIFFFKDIRVVAAQRKSIQSSISVKQVDKAIRAERQDYFLSILCSFYMFFVAYVTFTNYEIIGSPLSIDMYGWSPERSTIYNGALLGSLGIMSIGVLIATKILAKRYQERVLLLGGTIICFIGYFVFLPWGDTYPDSQIATVSTAPPLSTTTSSHMNYTTIAPTTTTEGGGCPLDYDWCQYIPIVQLWQYILASIIITTGFTICNVICYSIVSKKLGHRPQGTIMGLMNSFGAAARSIGPVVVGFIYAHDGPRAMFILMLSILFISIIVVMFNYRRLYIEPVVEEDEDVEDVEEGEANGAISDDGD